MLNLCCTGVSKNPRFLKKALNLLTKKSYSFGLIKFTFVISSLLFSSILKQTSKSLSRLAISVKFIRKTCLTSKTRKTVLTGKADKSRKSRKVEKADKTGKSV